jgi:hypothetical protein
VNAGAGLPRYCLPASEHHASNHAIRKTVLDLAASILAMTEWSASSPRRHDMTLKLISAITLATLIAAPASAGPLRDAFVRQQTSITTGVANGTVKPGEFVRLQRQQASILRQAKFLQKTGGGLNGVEKAYIGARMIAARGAIYYHKHN